MERPFRFKTRLKTGWRQTSAQTSGSDFSPESDPAKSGLARQISYPRSPRRYPVFSENSLSKPEREFRSAPSQYQFLVGKHIDQETLDRSELLAKRWNVPPHHVMLAMGWITSKNYTEAVADSFALNHLTHVPGYVLDLPKSADLISASYRSGLFRGSKKHFDGAILSATSFYPNSIQRLSLELGSSKNRVALASPDDLRSAISEQAGPLLTRQAIDGLEETAPGLSARSGLSKTQILALGLILISLSLALFYSPEASTTPLAFLLSAAFLPVVLLRLLACYLAFWRPSVQKRDTPMRQMTNWSVSDAILPVYTILVPVFRERTILPDLIQALLRLDYPRARLDIKLIFEESDPDTFEIAQTLAIPDFIDFIVVPDSTPRTKPKALNYAMQFAKGDYVTIYDAEDQPEPDQLRKAVELFRNSPAHVACLQARLNFYNASENWLTRQFSIEYASLFNGLLPTLQTLKAPLPLGGTSNHFRMSALKSLGGWDAFNVTEDADLGMRLYRHGYLCQMLDSVTYEEATCHTMSWIRQRTRWIKGWMQTYAVHMRSPLQLLGQLGLKGFIGFQTVLGGFILSALIHPVFLCYALFHITTGITSPHFQSGSFLTTAFLSHLDLGHLAFFNLCFGYGSAILLGACIQKDIRLSFLPLHLLSMPFYWLLISIAAYRAVIQLFYAPFVWEKTTHGVSRLKPSCKVR